MSGYGPSEDHQPVAWLRGHPVYAAHLVALVFIASMVATAILMAFNLAHLWSWLPFLSAGVLKGEVWRILTYGLVNPPSLWFAVDMAMIVLFGREVEKFFGRRKFMVLYGCLYLLPPLLFTLVGAWFPTRLVGETGAFAVFVAFATLYPDAVLLWGFLAKWMAAVVFGIYSLMALAYHDWMGGLSLWATCGFAFAFVRHEQGRLTLPRFGPFRRRPRFRVLPGYKGGAPEGATPAKAGSAAEVDALLDKIAKSGFSSLSAKERARLDAARSELLRRESRRK
jgi:Rhomboid family